MVEENHTESSEGIRVGYYTQAASLWVANFYAQHEAPYLHTVTLLFLIALLIGICSMSTDPSKVHAVEPFMLMQVAYNVKSVVQLSYYC
jgi:hypothetical protein